MNDSCTIIPIRADLASAASLQAVEHDSLGDSDLSVDELYAVLCRPEQRAYLAYAGGAAKQPAEVTGFCFCLLTDSPQGPRLEIDMLGVRPAYRNQGVAGRLVAYAMAEARAAGVRRFRGVVAEDNSASLRVFERLGFATTAEPHTMRVYALAGLAPVPFLPAGWRQTSDVLPGGLDGAVPREIHRIFAPGPASSGWTLAGESELLEVHTLSYSGLWVERLWAKDAAALRLLARSAVERAKRAALDEVGYLLPAHLAGEQEEVMVGQGFDAVGRYFVLQAGDESR